MSLHQTICGIEEDELGFVSIRCECGWQSGPMPDTETLIDSVMEHAFEAGACE